MRLLLDTHVLIAVVGERSDAVGPLVWDAVTAPDAVVHASVASLWEIAIKVRLGKLALSVAPTSLPTLLQQLDLRLVAIEHAHVLADLEPQPATRDPFDRLLLAQCLVENLRLVTLDRVLAVHPLAWRPPAR